MLLQAASPLAIPIIVLDPEIPSPAKQVSSPSLHPINSLNPTNPLQHIDGAFTSADKIRLLASQVDILTIEIEHVDVEALQSIADEFKSKGGRLNKGIKVYPSPSVIRIIQDKFQQKVFLANKGIPVAPFVQITASSSISVASGSSSSSSGGGKESPHQILVESILSAGKEFGYPLMLKSRHLAYDGKGNYVLRSSSPSAVLAALEALIPLSSIPTGKPLNERLYAEKFAPFVKEVAVMVVRGTSGETRLYPAVETIHRESVCHIVYCPLRPPTGDEFGVGKKQRGKSLVVDGGKEVGVRASEAAGRAVDALGDGAVGVFGVEMFLMADGKFIFPRRLNLHFSFY